jgi:hypothetical protein
MIAVPRRLGVIILALAIAAGLALTAVPATARPAGEEHLPDLQTIVPTNAFSIVTTPEGREFRYTHLVYNNGPGPLEIQPAYDDAIGGYRGRQMIFSHDGGGRWSQVRDRRVPDTFVFHAEHGHFHFPLASFGLYAVAADGGFGPAVALSPKIGYCIDDSYLSNSDLEHSGAFIGSRTSCADPTGLRGISVGGADEYDYRDPGQAVPIDGLADGTYWFRAMTDPNDDMVELDESNNETDVLVTITNGTVTPGRVLHPDTTPPRGSFSTPRDGQVVSGMLPLTVSTPTAGVRRVEFVVDGDVVGAATGTNTFTYGWQTTSVVDGEHWLSARIVDEQGRVGNTGVIPVVVSNVASPPSGGALVLERSVSRDGRNAQTAPTLTGLSGGELLVAMVSADGPEDLPQTAAVSGGGLSWVLARRTNGQAGTSEVWKAVVPADPRDVTVTSTPGHTGYDQSLTVLVFDGSAGIGASSGAGAAAGPPKTSLTTSRAGSWVFGVGNDWDVAQARTVGAEQIIRHQWVDSAVGDTFWVQSRSQQTPAAGTTVTIDDTAPTTGRWNLAAVEVLASSHTPPPDETAPTVKITDPEAGTKLRGIVAVGATAADNVGVTAVRFVVDGKVIATDTEPPFTTDWDTTTAANGNHTLAAEATDAAGSTGRSAAVAVTVDNSGPAPATIIIESKVVRQGTGELTSPAITTTYADDLLVAFVGMDGPESATQSATVTGAGLTWTLVKRSNTQAGVSEIWAAKAKGKLAGQVVTATPARPGFVGALTVMAFRNASGTGVAGAAGAPSGRPSIYLPAVSAASWVFAVGNDWDRASARKPVTGQVLQQQWLADPPGDTFWVQSTAAPTTKAGLVTITDDLPTTDRWNLAAVEIKAVNG